MLLDIHCYRITAAWTNSSSQIWETTCKHFLLLSVHTYRQKSESCLMRAHFRLFLGYIPTGMQTDLKWEEDKTLTLAQPLLSLLLSSLKTKCCWKPLLTCHAGTKSERKEWYWSFNLTQHQIWRMRAPEQVIIHCQRKTGRTWQEKKYCQCAFTVLRDSATTQKEHF